VLPAIMDISARAISLAVRPRPGHSGHQCSHAPGRPILHLVSSSRRPQRVGGRSYVITRSSSCAVPLFVPRAVPSSRPAHVARRRAQGAVPAGRRADLTSRSAAARPRLDGPEHGARIKRVGQPHRWSFSFRSRAPWPAPPRRYGQACWRAQSRARCGVAASWRLRSRA
jgi:hypothetical protein